MLSVANLGCRRTDGYHAPRTYHVDSSGALARMDDADSVGQSSCDPDIRSKTWLCLDLKCIRVECNLHVQLYRETMAMPTCPLGANCRGTTCLDPKCVLFRRSAHHYGLGQAVNDAKEPCGGTCDPARCDCCSNCCSSYTCFVEFHKSGKRVPAGTRRGAGHANQFERHLFGPAESSNVCPFCRQIHLCSSGGDGLVCRECGRYDVSKPDAPDTEAELKGRGLAPIGMRLFSEGTLYDYEPHPSWDPKAFDKRKYSRQEKWFRGDFEWDPWGKLVFGPLRRDLFEDFSKAPRTPGSKIPHISIVHAFKLLVEHVSVLGKVMDSLCDRYQKFAQKDKDSKSRDPSEFVKTKAMCRELISALVVFTARDGLKKAKVSAPSGPELILHLGLPRHLYREQKDSQFESWPDKIRDRLGWTNDLWTFVREAGVPLLFMALRYTGFNPSLVGRAMARHATEFLQATEDEDLSLHRSRFPNVFADLCKFLEPLLAKEVVPGALLFSQADGKTLSRSAQMERDTLKCIRQYLETESKRAVPLPDGKPSTLVERKSRCEQERIARSEIPDHFLPLCAWLFAGLVQSSTWTNFTDSDARTYQHWASAVIYRAGILLRLYPNPTVATIRKTQVIKELRCLHVFLVISPAVAGTESHGSSDQNNLLSGDLRVRLYEAVLALFMHDSMDDADETRNAQRDRCLTRLAEIIRPETLESFLEVSVGDDKKVRSAKMDLKSLSDAFARYPDLKSLDPERLLWHCTFWPQWVLLWRIKDYAMANNDFRCSHLLHEALHLDSARVGEQLPFDPSFVVNWSCVRWFNIAERYPSFRQFVQAGMSTEPVKFTDIKSLSMPVPH